MDKTDELNQHSLGLMFKTKNGSDEINGLNKKIEEATKIFHKERDVARFLRNVTFGDKLEVFFKERIYFDGVDDYNFDEDSGFEENEEEDFIPNDFNAISIFFRQTKVAVTLKRKVEEKSQICKKT